MVSPAPSIIALIPFTVALSFATSGLSIAKVRSVAPPRSAQTRDTSDDGVLDIEEAVKSRLGVTVAPKATLHSARRPMERAMNQPRSKRRHHCLWPLADFRAPSVF